jgi:hypothetical protein
MGTEEPRAASQGSIPQRLVAWARARPGFSLFVIAAASAIVYLSYNVFWPGDRIRIKAALSEVLDGLQDADADAIIDRFSPYFSQDGMDKQRLSRSLRRVLHQRTVSNATLSIRQVHIAAHWAHVQVHVRSSHEGPYGAAFTGSDWLIIMEELNGRWLIRQARPVAVQGHRTVGLRELLDQRSY